MAESPNKKNQVVEILVALIALAKRYQWRYVQTLENLREELEARHPDLSTTGAGEIFPLEPEKGSPDSGIPQYPRVAGAILQAIRDLTFYINLCQKAFVENKKDLKKNLLFWRMLSIN